MKKIESLTNDQISQTESYVDTWLKVGLSCEPIVFDAAVDAVKLAIKCSNTLPDNETKMPTKWHYAKGPREAFKIAKEIKNVSVDEFLGNTLWGSHDADWVSFQCFMKDVVGVKNIEIFEGLYQMALNCGWTTVIDDHCIIQDRPKSIKFDEQNRAHCENGPAIEYRDGFSVMCWHGTRFPREWVLKGISASEALQVVNSELRRVACEIVGWNQILYQLNYKVIEQDEDPMIGTLVEVNLPISEDGSSLERFLMVKCGTGRDFALPVPPDMKTALQANAWTYGLEAHEYNPEVRT